MKPAISASIDQMMEDLELADPLYQPSPYWAPHTQKLASWIKEHGFDDFRSHSVKSINAFGETGLTQPPDDSRFNALHARLLAVPGLKRIAQKYEQEIGTWRGKAAAQFDYRLRITHENVRLRNKELAELDDGLVGNPFTAEIRGKRYSATFLDHLMDYAQLEQRVDTRELQVIVEIGGGFGAFTEVVLRMNPKAVAVVVDLPPVIAFAEFYLSKIFPGEVLGYAATRDLDKVDPRSGEHRVIVLPSFGLEKLVGPIDLLVNKASFQEMSVAIVGNYARVAQERGLRMAYLKNARAEAQTRPGLSTDFYLSTFSPMALTASWPDALHPAYDHLILSTP